MRALATVRSDVVGMTIGDSRFFVPSLIPENIPERIEEYFKLLAEALTSCRNKLIAELPEWVDSFRFSDEMALMRQRSAPSDELRRLDQEIAAIRRLKTILLFDGARLVEEVANALQQGLGFVVGREEKYREDSAIFDSQGQVLVLAEVKGTNRGVKREHINQADSHRERSGLAPDFPTLLIMNTHIRSARRIDEKDVEIAAEQIRHASNNNVLIIGRWTSFG
jgi:hypothetical protein